MHARSHGGREEPHRGSGRLQTDVRAQRAARLREGLQHRQAASARQRQGQDLRSRRADRDPLFAGIESGHISPFLKLQHALFDRLVYVKLRARSVAIASRPCRVAHLWAIGSDISSGASASRSTRATASPETSAGICVNRPDAIKIGTVGRPVGGSSARIADDGELLLRGGMVFRGYWRNDAATAEAIDADGWFHSGDIGEIATTATSGSPAVRRRSSLPRAARTSRRPCSRTACAHTGWCRSAWSSETASRSSPR